MEASNEMFALNTSAELLSIFNKLNSHMFTQTRPKIALAAKGFSSSCTLNDFGMTRQSIGYSVLLEFPAECNLND